MKFLIVFLLLTSTAFAKVKCEQAEIKLLSGLERMVWVCIDSDTNALIQMPEDLQKKLRERVKKTK
jgi:hypothetical protein